MLVCEFNLAHWRNKASTNPIVSSYNFTLDGDKLGAVIKVPRAEGGKRITSNDLLVILGRLDIESIVLTSESELTSEFKVHINSDAEFKVGIRIANALNDAMTVIDAYRLS